MTDQNNLARGYDLAEDDPLDELARMVGGQQQRPASRAVEPKPAERRSETRATSRQPGLPAREVPETTGEPADAAAGPAQPPARRLSENSMAERYERYRAEREAERARARSTVAAANRPQPRSLATPVAPTAGRAAGPAPRSQSAPATGVAAPRSPANAAAGANLFQELDVSIAEAVDDEFDLHGDASAELLGQLAAIAEPEPEAKPEPAAAYGTETGTGPEPAFDFLAELEAAARAEMPVEAPAEPASAPLEEIDVEFSSIEFTEEDFADIATMDVAPVEALEAETWRDEAAPEPVAAIGQGDMSELALEDELMAELSLARQSAPEQARSASVSFDAPKSGRSASPAATFDDDFDLEKLLANEAAAISAESAPRAPASDYERAFDAVLADELPVEADPFDVAEDAAFEALIAAHMDDARDPFAPSPRVGREPVTAAPESEDINDLANAFERSFNAELAVGRAGDEVRAASARQDTPFAPPPRQRSGGDIARSLEADLAELEAVIAGNHQPPPQTRRANFQAPQPARAPVQAPPADDFDFSEALDSELDEIVEETPAPVASARQTFRGPQAAAYPSASARAPASRPHVAHESERGIEDQFASAFAEELGIGGQPRHAAVNPVRATQGPVEEYPQYDDEEDMSVPVPRPRGRRSGFRLAAYALGVALVFGLGAVGYGYFRGTGASEGPLVVKADSGPVKVRPETPGGTDVANQDQAAYDRVAGKFEPGSTQEKLVTSTQKPVVLPATTTPQVSAVEEDGVELASEEEIAVDDGSRTLASASETAVPVQEAGTPGKADERLEPEDLSVPVASIATLEPRRVRTLTVRPDGTIVNAPAEPAAQTSETAFAPAQREVAAPAVNSIDGAVSSGIIPVPDPRPDASAARPQTAAPAPLVTNTASIEAPRAPVVPAAADASVRTAALGQWAVQVSSRRSAEEAEAAYRDISGRFPDLLRGRQMSIQRADVPDKGVFFRVRIQSESKAEADSLCANLKQAGGSCFVTQ